MRAEEDDADPRNAPNIVDPELERQNSASTGLTPEGQNFGTQSWMAEQQMGPAREAHGMPMQGMSVMQPGSAGMVGFVQSEGSGDSNDISVSPGAQSSGPTPNSSHASDPSKSRSVGGQVGGSGSNSFNASPAPTHQTIPSQPGGVDGAPANFYGANAFGISNPGMAPNQRYAVPQPAMADFGMAGGWSDMPGQQGIEPVAEGVLRSLMNMGPMDAMDLSSWESGN